METHVYCIEIRQQSCSINVVHKQPNNYYMKRCDSLSAHVDLCPTSTQLLHGTTLRLGTRFLHGTTLGLGTKKQSNPTLRDSRLI